MARADRRRIERPGPRSDPPRAAQVAAPEPLLLALQRSAGNRAVSRLLARQPAAAAATSTDPKGYDTYEDWLQSLPSGAVDYTSVDITGDVRKSEPGLADLVTDLRADCADVTILLRHYYLAAHGKTEPIPVYDPKAEGKRTKYMIGSGVTRASLRRAVVDIGTIHFQEKGKGPLAFVDYYGGSRPLKNLAKIAAAGLEPGDLLIWKKIAGIEGDFSGHVQTVQRVNAPHLVAAGESGPEAAGSIEVLQGTMETGRGGFGQIQSKVLTFELLTGKRDGDGEITYKPAGEEDFYGAGKWR